jgi:DNA-binding transcriptional LysR family regulator
MPLLSEFLATYPEVTIEAQYSQDFVGLVSERFDLAIRLGILGDSRLIARKSGVRQRLLCASPAYREEHGVPRTAEDLKHHACLRYESGLQSSVWEMTGPSGKVERVRVSGPPRWRHLYPGGRSDGGSRHDALGELGDRLCGCGRQDRPDRDRLHHHRRGWHLHRDAVGAGMLNKTRAFADWIVEWLGRSPWLVSTTTRAWSPGITTMGLGRGMKPRSRPQA